MFDFANDNRASNLSPVFAEIIEAFFNPPPAIRDMERDIISRMRAERSEDLEVLLAEKEMEGRNV